MKWQSLVDDFDIERGNVSMQVGFALRAAEFHPTFLRFTLFLLLSLILLKTTGGSHTCHGHMPWSLLGRSRLDSTRGEKVTINKSEWLCKTSRRRADYDKIPLQHWQRSLYTRHGLIKALPINLSKIRTSSRTSIMDKTQNNHLRKPFTHTQRNTHNTLPLQHNSMLP